MKNSTILIIENDTNLWKNFSNALAPLKREILFANSFEEGIALINNSRVEIILFNISSEKDGMEKLSHIRLEFPVVRVIALLDENSADKVVEVKKRGAFSCLAIPTDPLQINYITAWALDDRSNYSTDVDFEEIYGKLFNAIPDGVLVLNTEGEIIHVNESFTEMFGYRCSKIIGKQVDSLVPERFRNHAKYLKGYLQNPEKRSIGQAKEFAALREDGSEFFVNISLIPYNTGHDLMIFAIIRDISERIKYQKQLLHQSTHDELTKLPNRTLLLDRIKQAIAYSDRYNRNISVLYVDLDHFKIINNSLGHDIGDILLRSIADKLSACIRASDTVARQSGDDFVILITDLENDHDIVKIAEKILWEITQPIQLSSQEIRVTCSIGISIYPRDGSDPMTLVKNADAAMFRAKEAGRNNYRFFTSQLAETAVERLTLENCLRRALLDDELSIMYQPQVDLTSGQITGVEALLRWNSSKLGPISPAKFIPIAEETGLILTFGEWVLAKACQQNSQWQQAGLPPIIMAVNLSPRQFWSTELTDFVRQTLLDCSLDPEFLELEIIESMVMRDKKNSITMLKELKEIGVKLAIDDFGTGYSSLSQLRNFPFDKLKMDISFVREITIDPGSAAIARTIISLGHNLGLRVIAEGVETEAQLNYLRNYNCDEMQGYYFSKPLHAEDMERLLRERHHLNLPKNKPVRSKTVLLVDDEPYILAAMKRLLHTHYSNVQILTANDAQEGLEQLALNDVDIVLSDQMMPGMDGLEFLNRVKGLHPNVMRMAMSAHADADMVASAINKNVISKFLLKPIDADLLYRIIDETEVHYQQP